MKEFDDILKKKLENLEVPYDPSHWKELEQQLDREENPQVPLVDALALSHLKELEVAPAPGSWDAFSEKLEAAEITTDPVSGVDRIAREQLEHLEQPYNPEHWPLMNQRLDEVFTLRGIIYRYKLAEIALMLLLLWTVLLHVEIPVGGERADWMQNDPESADLPAAPLDDQEALPSNPTSTTPATDGQPPLNFEPASVPVAEAEVPLQQTTPLVSQSTEDSGSAVNSPIEENDVITAEVAQEETRSEEEALLPIPGAEHHLESSENIPAVVKVDFHPLDPVASLQIRPNAGLTGLGIKEAAPIARLKDTHLRVTMLTGPDYNRIYTPADPVFGTQGTYIDSMGFSAGVLVDFQRGGWTFQTGGMYLYKSYRPVLPEQQFGTFDLLVVESFEGISMEMLQIPLNIRYNFLQGNTKWDFYLQGGVGANLLLKPIYDIRQESLQSEEFAKRPNPDEVRSVNSKSKLNEKEFPQGLLDGGALRENSYLTTSVGIGLERYLTDRWSLFLQPQLQYQLPFDGFGPNSDRFHSLSLRLGVRVIVW